MRHAVADLHQRVLNVPRLLVSCRYSVICWSERCRPNQVFHQNRNGMRTISQPVTKKRIFWVRDMPRLGFGSSTAAVVRTDWEMLKPRV